MSLFQVNERGFSALHFASSSRQGALCQELLLAHGAHINMQVCFDTTLNTKTRTQKKESRHKQQDPVQCSGVKRVTSYLKKKYKTVLPLFNSFCSSE